MKTILKVITGSKLHGLDTPTSDTDFRGVFMLDVAEMVDPFNKPPETIWLEGEGKDDTASELRKFIREVIKGGPNAVEILFSNQIVDQTAEGGHMLGFREKFIDENAVFNAFKNYSDNQMNKMNIWEPDARTPKFAVAYIRSLLNGVELLRDGVITNPVPDVFTLTDGTEIAAREILMRVKMTPFEEFGGVIEEAMKMFTLLRSELSAVFYAKQGKIRKADTEWITQFVKDVYSA